MFVQCINIDLFFLLSMSQLVHAPALVREMDWASHVWPTDLPEDR